MPCAVVQHLSGPPGRSDAGNDVRRRRLSSWSSGPLEHRTPSRAVPGRPARRRSKMRVTACDRSSSLASPDERRGASSALLLLGRVSIPARHLGRARLRAGCQRRAAEPSSRSPRGGASERAGTVPPSTSELVGAVLLTHNIVDCPMGDLRVEHPDDVDESTREPSHRCRRRRRRVGKCLSSRHAFVRLRGALDVRRVQVADQPRVLGAGKHNGSASHAPVRHCDGKVSN